MKHEVVETVSPWEDSHFPRQEDTGVVLGLNWKQVIVAGGAVGVATLLVVLGGFKLLIPAGIVAVVGVVVGATKIHNRSLIAWIAIATVNLLRAAAGQLRYVRGVPTIELFGDPGQPVLIAGEEPSRDKKGRIEPGEPSRIRLPGEHAELLAYGLPGGAGMVYDPRTHEATVVAKIKTSKAFALESQGTKEQRTGFFSDAMNELSSIPGVAWWKLSDQTTLISGRHVKDFYRRKQQEASTVERNGTHVRLAGKEIDPFLDASFESLMTEAQGMPVHEQWMTIAISRAKIAGQITAMGGGIATLMEIALSVMDAAESTLPESGTEVTHWHSVRSMAALSRSAFDPESTVAISDRSGEFAGVHPDSAGPMGLYPYNNCVDTDGYLHRTFIVTEWPQSKARLGFLSELVFAGDFRHTVTVMMQPQDARKTMKQVQGRKADWQTSQNLRQRWKSSDSLEHIRQREDIDIEEEEMVDGHAPVLMAALITVSAKTLTQLEDHCLQLLTRVAKAQCEVRPAYMEQDAAFIGAAVPFGRIELTND